MKKICLVVLLLLCKINYADEKVIVSPGLKLGYAFGEKGGFVFGFEVSFVSGNDSFEHSRFYGAVLSFEKMKNEYRLHIGAQMNLADKEGAWCLLGIEVGPTYIFRETNNAIGINVTPYFGAFIIPYYRMLIIPKEYIQHEIGSFIKLHLPVKGDYSVS